MPTPTKSAKPLIVRSGPSGSTSSRFRASPNPPKMPIPCVSTRHVGGTTRRKPPKTARAAISAPAGSSVASRRSRLPPPYQVVTEARRSAGAVLASSIPSKIATRSSSSSAGPPCDVIRPRATIAASAEAVSTMKVRSSAIGRMGYLLGMVLSTIFRTQDRPGKIRVALPGGSGRNADPRDVSGKELQHRLRLVDPLIDLERRVAGREQVQLVRMVPFGQPVHVGHDLADRTP